MALLIPLSLILVYFLLNIPDRRVRFLASTVITITGLVIITEGLSAFHMLSTVPLAIAWAAFDIILISIFIIRRRWKDLRPVVWQWQFDRFETLLVAGMVALSLLLGLIAVVAAPNNWDSMAYHLPRIMEWIQQRSLAHFPTSNLYQLFLAPGAEYIQLNVMLLSNTADRWVNLVQWCCLLGCTLSASAIAKQLGAKRRGQVLAAVAVITIPMAVMQSTTTQNDLTVAFWLITFIVFIIEDNRQPSSINILLAGLALGLAMLTKPTAYIYAAPFLIGWVIWRLWRYRLKTLPILATAGFISLLLCMPYWQRNWQVFHNPLGSEDNSGNFFNHKISPIGLGLNLLRNLGTHVMLPEEWVEPASEELAKVLSEVNINLNDPNYTRPDHSFTLPAISFNEDRSGNFIHLIVVLAVPVVLIGRKKNLSGRIWWLYFLAWSITILLMSLVQRWQIYQARYHLPWFIIAAPLIGLSGEHVNKWVQWLSAFILLIGIVPFIWFSPTKPLWTDWNIFNLPRREVMMRREDMMVDYVKAQELLSRDLDCYTVGLVSGPYDWEYPLWALLRDAKWRSSDKPYHIQHILVENESSRLEGGSYRPCVLLVTALERPKEINYGNQTYLPILETGYVWVYAP